MVVGCSVQGHKHQMYGQYQPNTAVSVVKVALSSLRDFWLVSIKLTEKLLIPRNPTMKLYTQCSSTAITTKEDTQEYPTKTYSDLQETLGAPP
jgi:hypothetical protein